MKIGTFVKFGILTVGMLAISGCVTKTSGAKDPTKDIAVKNLKDMIVSNNSMEILAEREKETVTLLNGSMDTLGIGSLNSFHDYCMMIKGNPIVGEQSGKWMGKRFSRGIVGLGMDAATDLNELYEEQSKKGITPYKGWYKCNSEVDGFEVKMSNDYFIAKHDQQQEIGYALKWTRNHYKTGDMSFDDVEDSRRLSVMASYCEEKGGEFYIANADTDKYAVSANQYYFLLAGEIEGKYVKFAQPGRMWCVDTKDKSDEFTIAFNKGTRGGVNIVASKGVNKDEIIKNESIAPSYMMVDKRNENKSEQGDETNAFITPTRLNAEKKVAENALDAKRTVLGRENGKVYEGIYIGRSNDGCEMAAVWDQPENPLYMKDVYRDNKSISYIENFKRCGNKTKYTGQSYETKLSRNIEPELDRVKDMCVAHGTASSVYLGYGIQCETVGNDTARGYMFTVIKSEKLVSRFYVK